MGFSGVENYNWFHNMKGLWFLLPETEEKYIKKVVKDGWDKEIFTMIAVSVITHFTHPLIHDILSEFDKPEYQGFCNGAENLRNFLKERAKTVAKIQSLKVCVHKKK
jgi:hypothetical protein